LFSYRLLWPVDERNLLQLFINKALRVLYRRDIIRAMQKKHTSLTIPVIRGLLILAFLWRLIDAFYVIRPLLTNLSYGSSIHSLFVGTQATLIGQVMKALADLLFLAMLVFGGNRRGIPMGCFAWLLCSNIAGEGWEALSCLEREYTTLAVLGFSLLAGSLFVIFQKVGIRGKIFIVCLVCALIPMSFLGGGMIRQAQLLNEHAVYPIAVDILIRQARRADDFIFSKYMEAMERFFRHDFATDIVQFDLVKEYRSRAYECGIPLIKTDEKVFGPHKISISLTDVLLSRCVLQIARQAGLNERILWKTNSDPRITLKFHAASIAEVLQYINETSGIRIQLVGKDLIVEDRKPGDELSSTFLKVISSSTSALRMINRKSRERNDLGSGTFVVSDRTGDQYTVSFSVPRFDEKHELTGRLLMTFDNGSFWRRALSDLPVDTEFPSTVPFVAREEKNFIDLFGGFRDTPSQVPVEKLFPDEKKLNVSREQIDFRNLSEYFSKKADTTDLPKVEMIFGLNSGLWLTSPNGKEWIIMQFLLPKSETSVRFAIPSKDVRWVLYNRQMKSFTLALWAVLLAAFMSFLYSEQLSQPIKEITEAAKRLHSGDLDVKIPIHGGQDEMKELSLALSSMAERLKGKIDVANKLALEEKAKFETLVESTWEGIFLLSADGVLLYSNPAGRQLLGDVNPSGSFLEALNKIGSEFQPPLPSALDLKVNELRALFTRPLPHEGSGLSISLYIRSLGSHAGSGGLPIAGFIAVCRDITVEKQIDRMKSEFVSQVSHELRTPLTSIMGYTEMLLDSDVEDRDKQKEYLNIIYDESGRLTRLINDLLDLARIESGKRVIKPVQLDMVQLTREVLYLLAAQIRQKKHEIEFSDPDYPVTFYGDADLLKQSGLNLLSNAVKYTPTDGTITITLAIDTNGEIVWKFTDTGIGMTPQELDRLFSKFFRADSEYVRSMEGTGLGLALVKQIVERHGGSISVASTFGKGSTFTVKLPGKPIFVHDAPIHAFDGKSDG